MVQFRTEHSSPSMLSAKVSAETALITQFARGEITYNMKATQTTNMADDSGSGTRNQVTRMTSRWLKTLWTLCYRRQANKSVDGIVCGFWNLCKPRKNLTHLSFLTWKIFIIFQVVVVERFHSITPSFPVRHLETRGELPCAKARSARGKIWI